MAVPRKSDRKPPKSQLPPGPVDRIPEPSVLPHGDQRDVSRSATCVDGRWTAEPERSEVEDCHSIRRELRFEVVTETGIEVGDAVEIGVRPKDEVRCRAVDAVPAVNSAAVCLVPVVIAGKRVAMKVPARNHIWIGSEMGGVDEGVGVVLGRGVRVRGRRGRRSCCGAAGVVVTAAGGISGGGGAGWRGSGEPGVGSKLTTRHRSDRAGLHQPQLRS